MERTLVLGIDAGSSRAAAVLAELGEGNPKVIGVGKAPCAGIRRGVVLDLESTGRSIAAAVNQACEMAKVAPVTRAVVSVSGAHIHSRVGKAEIAVHRPSVGVCAEDVRKVLDQAAAVQLSEGREVIHVVPRAYRLDGESAVMEPVGLAGRRLEAEAHLIAGEALPVQNSLRAYMRAGLEITDYLVGIRAAGQAILTPEERAGGVLLLDIGAGTTGVAVYDRGHLYHLSVLPVGGEHITADLASLLHVPVGVAERLKIERGWAASDLAPDEHFELVSPSGQKVRELEDKRLAEIIEPRVNEILSLAAEQVKRSGYGGLFPGGLVLTGGGSRLQGLLQVAADSLGLPARQGAPEDPLVAEPEYATALGLVLWGSRLVEDEAVAAAAEKQPDEWSRLWGWVKGIFQKAPKEDT